MTRDEDRRNRIENRVLVDAYTRDEQATGWYAYLHDILEFPFEARCTEAMERSPLRAGETTRVVGMPHAEPSLRQQFVTIEWKGRELGVPLRQLEPLDASEQTRQAIADWHYWVDR